MSDRVRICDACGEENEPSSVICACGQPISHILASTKTSPQERTPPLPTQSSAGKICLRCGTSNPPHRLSCNCGERLPLAGDSKNENQFSEPSQPGGLTFIESTRDKSTHELFLQFANQRIALQDGDVLGREGTVAASSFAVIKEVSRKHACIQRKLDGWYIIGLSQNITEVDGQPLERGKAHKLSGKHRVRLSSKCEINLEAE